MKETTNIYQEAPASQMESHEKKEMEVPNPAQQNIQPPSGCSEQVYYQPEAPQQPVYGQAPQEMGNPELSQQGYYQPMGNPGFAQAQQPLYTQAPQGYYQNMGAPEVPQQGYYQQPMPGPQYFQPQPGAALNSYQVPQYFPQGYIQPLINPYMGMQPQEECSCDDHTDHTDCGDDHDHSTFPKHDENKYGQFMEIVNDVASGKPPEMSKIMEFMNGTDTQFLKGAVVGAVSTFLLTNETVKATAVNMVAKVMNAFGKTE